MSNRKREPVATVDSWCCNLCAADLPVFDGAASFIAHCRETHPEIVGEDGKIPASREGVAFLDGSDFFRNEFTWKLPDGRVLAGQTIQGTRGKGDPMRDAP